MTNNPLINKYNEIHNPKPPEPPKPVEKPRKITTYDPDSANDAFLQIAEKVKNGTALVKTVSIEVDHYGMFSYGKNITFEVWDYEEP